MQRCSILKLSADGKAWADTGEAFRAFGQTAPVSSVSIIHPVIPTGSSLLAVRSSAGRKARNRWRMGGKPASGTKLSCHRIQPSPALPRVGHCRDISGGVQAEGRRGLEVGNALAELRDPGESRKMAGQAISPEHNAPAEVSTRAVREAAAPISYGEEQPPSGTAPGTVCAC